MTESDTTPEYDPELVAAVPQAERFGRVAFTQLFDAGYDGWRADGEAHFDKLADDVESYYHDVQRAARDDSDKIKYPYIDDPGMLAVVSTLAGLVALEHEVFSETRPPSAQPWVNIREAYTKAIVRYVREHMGTGLFIDVADHLLRKPPATNVRPHSGRTVVDVIPADHEEDYQGFVEVPLVAASRECLALTTEDNHNQEDESTPSSGRPDTSSSDTDQDSIIDIIDPAYRVDEVDQTVEARLEDNHLLVPVGHIFDLYEEEIRSTGFADLFQAQQAFVDDEQRDRLCSGMSRIHDTIGRLAHKSNRQDLLWTYVNRKEQIVDLIADLVDSYPDEVIARGEPITAKEIKTGLNSDHYDPDPSLESTYHELRNYPADHIGAKIVDASGDDRLEVIDHPDTNEYVLRESIGDADSLEVTHVRDFLQLPCYQEMDQRLQEEGPTRKELYDWVRKAAWLPTYRDHGEPNVEVLVDHFKTVFEDRYDWFDPQITEYQVRYELRDDPGRQARFDSGEPLPAGCNNPMMEQYCVGKRACPHYHLYSAVPFDDAMYAALDDLDSDDDPPEYEAPP